MNRLLANKAKRKKHRKAIRESEFIARDKQIRAKEKWLQEYYESRSDYPVTKSKQKLTWQQVKKYFKQKSKRP